MKIKVIGHNCAGTKQRDATDKTRVSSLSKICAASHPSPTNHDNRNEAIAKGVADRPNIKNLR
jgi:hypothetical protein